MVIQKLPSIARAYVPLAVAVTLIAGLIYLAGQQIARQGANDPQIQMAEDAAALLSAGARLPETGPVDIATSLAPYVIVFDGQGRPVSGSARLHGSLPTVPPGVLTYAQQHGENRVTWQPEPGVRGATVVAPLHGAQPGYVLVGRSLREVEHRVDVLGTLVVLGWLATLGVVLVVVVVANLL